jgi:hypothetical protein
VELSDAVSTTIRGGRERRLGGRSTDGGENEEGRAPPRVVGEGAKEGWRVDQSALGWASGSHSSVGG